MEKLAETQRFPTYNPKENFEEWMASFQCWIENKIYAELAIKINWLLSNTVLLNAEKLTFGDPNKNGSWQIIKSDNDLNFERRESGAWIAKGAINS